MTPATLAQADLFGDLEQAHAGPARRAYGKLGRAGAGRVRRGAQAFDHEVAAQALEASED